MRGPELGSADSRSVFRGPPSLDCAASFAPRETGSQSLLHSDSIARLGLCAMLVAAGASSLLRAAQRPFWYDEIYTLVLSRLATVPGIWSALQDAVDTNPPLYYLVARLASQLPLPAEVSFRLPSTLGCLLFCVCLFLLARPIGGPTAGLIAAFIPLATPIYDLYAIEARPYARKHVAVRVDDFQEFAQDHPSFLLLSPHDSNGDYFDWWQRRLADDGYALRVEAIRDRQVLYLVQR